MPNAHGMMTGEELRRRMAMQADQNAAAATARTEHEAKKAAHDAAMEVAAGAIVLPRHIDEALASVREAGTREREYFDAKAPPGPNIIGVIEMQKEMLIGAVLRRADPSQHFAALAACVLYALAAYLSQNEAYRGAVNDTGRPDNGGSAAAGTAARDPDDVDGPGTEAIDEDAGAGTQLPEGRGRTDLHCVDDDA